MSRKLLEFIAEYRRTGGAIGHILQSDGDAIAQKCLLLTTIHYRDQGEHTRPVLYTELGPRSYLVAASNGGAISNPTWYRNIVACPVAVVQIEESVLDVNLRIMHGSERLSAWDKLTATYPGYVEYQKKLDGIRTIPVVQLVF